jgi:hypothetical protein
MSDQGIKSDIGLLRNFADLVSNQTVQIAQPRRSLHCMRPIMAHLRHPGRFWAGPLMRRNRTSRVNDHHHTPRGRREGSVLPSGRDRLLPSAGFNITMNGIDEIESTAIAQNPAAPN